MSPVLARKTSRKPEAALAHLARVEANQDIFDLHACPPSTNASAKRSVLASLSRLGGSACLVQPAAQFGLQHLAVIIPWQRVVKR
jgi:hypothetical protein